MALIIVVSFGLAGCLMIGESSKLSYPEAVRMFGTPSQTMPASSGGKTVVFEKPSQGSYTLTFDKSDTCVGYQHTPASAASQARDQQGVDVHAGPVIGKRCS